jgi:hypothetical protein
VIKSISPFGEPVPFRREGKVEEISEDKRKTNNDPSIENISP